MKIIKNFFLFDLPKSNDPKTYLQEEKQILYDTFPDFRSAEKLTQNQYHRETLLDHLIDCYSIGLIYTQNSIFALACLFHDIGKVATRTWSEEKQDWTFHRHEVVGAYLTKQWMIASGFNRLDTQRVFHAIRHHQFRFFSHTKDRTIRSWLNSIGQQTWNDVRLLRLMDRMANQANDKKNILCEKLMEVDNRVSSLADTIWNS